MINRLTRSAAIARARRAGKEIQRVLDVLEERRQSPAGIYITRTELAWLEKAVEHMKAAEELLSPKG